MYLKRFFLIVFVTASFSCIGKTQVSLLFHAGVGANGVFDIGGVIENTSAEPVLNVAITYIVIDKKCHAGKARIENLGPIKSGSSLDFRIPVDGVMSSYRILSISAWNHIGIPFDTYDATYNIIKDRDGDIEKKCKQINSNG